MASGNAIAAWILGTIGVVIIVSLLITLAVYLIIFRDCKLYCKIHCHNKNGTLGDDPPRIGHRSKVQPRT